MAHAMGVEWRRNPQCPNYGQDVRVMRRGCELDENNAREIEEVIDSFYNNCVSSVRHLFVSTLNYLSQ